VGEKRIWIDGKPTKITIKEDPPYVSNNYSFDIDWFALFVVFGLYLWYDWAHNWRIAHAIWVVLFIVYSLFEYAIRMMWLVLSFFFGIFF